jgi:hypothetical protein
VRSRVGALVLNVSINFDKCDSNYIPDSVDVVHLETVLPRPLFRHRRQRPVNLLPHLVRHGRVQHVAVVAQARLVRVRHHRLAKGLANVAVFYKIVFL